MRPKFSKAQSTLVSLVLILFSVSCQVYAEDKAAASKGFTDIEDFNGEKEINDLVKAGVLKTDSGKFEPAKPITRAQFVAWLVKSNNVLRPDKKIRPADPGSKSTFPDLANTHPQFKYVQGMANAGWSVGYDDKSFKPDKELTREEMIAIKSPVDRGETLAKVDYKSPWQDFNKVGKRFQGPMSWEGYKDRNWTRCFGKTKNCEPQKPVTRAEAAVCVWQFGGTNDPLVTCENFK